MCAAKADHCIIMITILTPGRLTNVSHKTAPIFGRHLSLCQCHSKCTPPTIVLPSVLIISEEMRNTHRLSSSSVNLYRHLCAHWTAMKMHIGHRHHRSSVLIILWANAWDDSAISQYCATLLCQGQIELCIRLWSWYICENMIPSSLFRGCSFVRLSSLLCWHFPLTNVSRDADQMFLRIIFIDNTASLEGWIYNPVEGKPLSLALRYPLRDDFLALSDDLDWVKEKSSTGVSFMLFWVM